MSAVTDVSTLAVKVTSDGIKETADGLNKIYKQADNAERRVKTLTSAVEKMSQAFQQGTASAQAYQAAVANANRTVGGSDKATSALTVAMKNLTGSIDQLVQNLGKVEIKSRQSAQAIDFHKNAMKDAHAAARGLSGALGALWVTYGNMIPLAAGLAIGASFKGIVTVGKDVEHTLESIRVKGEETTENIKKMRESILSLGQGIYAPKEVAGAFETLILAGAKAEDALIGIKDALNLATVGGTSIEKSAYAIVQVATSLGFTANGYTRVADVIAKTAATSMSSVESISEAFKSGSAVAKLYGASLVDIGTSFAALSNLGIQGSAAGTSLKNFYKELAAESKKVTQTFAELGLKSADLKDASGNFLPLAELLPKLSDGLNQLSEAEQKTALNRLANERGLKTLVELLSLYRTQTVETQNAFKGMNDAIENSYGYTAIGAAAMALTVNNQLKSVGNTLQTTFVKAFQDIQPQLSVISTRLKQTFTSPEFISGVQQVSLALAEMAAWVVENIPFLTNLVTVLLSFKAAAFVAGLVVSIAQGMLALKAAADAAKISALAFQASLGVFGLVLAGVALAMGYFITQKEKLGTSTQAQASLSYINNFTEALDEEAKRLETQIDLMKKGKTAAESYTEAMRERNLEMVREQGGKMVAEAQANADKLKAGMTPAELKAYNRVKAEGGTGHQLYGKVGEVIAAEQAVTKAVQDSAKAYDEAYRAMERVRALSYQKAAEEEKQAKERNKNGNAGTGVLGTLGGENGKHKMSMGEKDLYHLISLVEGYKAKAEALKTAGDTELKVMADTEQARIKALIDEGKYADEHSKHFIERLKQKALEADLAKFELDKQTALAEMSSKITKQMNVENAAIAEANTGHSKLVGTLEAEAKELLRIWQIDEASDRGQKLLQEARAAGELAVQREKLTKFNKATETLKTEAASLMEQADAIMEFGKSGKQTALQLAELKIAQEGLNPALAEGAIQARLQAAATKDVATAYRDLAKLAADITDKNRELEANMVADILSSEAEKVMAKRETMLKAIEFSTQQAEAARNLGIMNKSWTDEQEAAYQRMIEGRKAAMAALDENTKLGLDKAAVKDSQTLLEEIKALGDGMESAFGKAGKAITGVLAGMQQLDVAQKQLNASMSLASRLRDKGDTAKAAKIEQEAIKSNARAQVKSYADMAGAAKGFFNENSKGYKVLHTVEQTFRAFEMAMALESFLTKSGFLTAFTSMFVTSKATETAAEVGSVAPTIAAEGAKQTAFGTTGLAAALSLPFPANIPAFAIVAAMLAAIGVAVSGGSGKKVDIAKERQAKQGTGTVLGDENAKSESISKALDILANNSNIALDYTSNMLSTLRGIRDGISGMANMVARTVGLRGTPTDIKGLDLGKTNVLGLGGTFGSLMGSIFGSTTKTLVDSGLVFHYTNEDKQTVGSVRRNGVNVQGYNEIETKKKSLFSSKTSTNDIYSDLPAEFVHQLNMTIDSMYDSVLMTVKKLGSSTEAAMTAMDSILLNEDAGLLKLSLKGKTAAEASEEIEAAISALGDVMAKKAMPQLVDFQKAGEGMFETLVRVGVGVDAANFALFKFGIAAIDYTKVANKQGDVATEIVRDSIKIKEGISGVGEIISTFSGTMDELVDAYKDLLEIRGLMQSSGSGTNLTRSTIYGAGGLDNLKSGVSSFFDLFFTDTEKLAAKTAQLGTKFAALGVTMPTSNEGFRNLVQGIDQSTEAGQKLYGQLVVLSGAFHDMTESAADLKQSEADRIYDDLERHYDNLERSVDAEKDRLTKLYEDEVKAIKKKADDDKALAKDQLKTAEEAEKAIKSVFDALKNALKSTKVESAALTEARRREAQAFLDRTLATSNAGGTLVKVSGLDEALETIAKPSENLFGTFEDYARDQARTAQTINGLIFNSERELDAAELTIKAINDTITAIEDTAERELSALERQHEADLARLDGILTAARQQIDELKGINTGILSLAQAQAAMNGALQAARQSTNPVVQATPQIAAAYQQYLYRDPEQSGLSYWQSQVANGTPVSQVVSQIANSNESKVQQLYENILGRVGEAAGVNYWTDKLNSGMSMTDLEKSFKSSAEYVSKTAQYQTDLANGVYRLHEGGTGMPSLDVGTNYVPYDMPANIHQGERIIPAADNAELMRRLKDDPATAKEERQQLIAAISDLKQTIISGDVANVQQARELLKLIRKWDGEGMPEERNIDV